MTDPSHPPKLAELFLMSMLIPGEKEVVLGDFEELFHKILGHSNVRKARSWYWMQVCRSAPALIQLKLSNEFERSFTTMIKNMNLHNKPSLLISLIALIPALIVIIPGIMQSGFGYFEANKALDATWVKVPVLKTLISPVVLLGGLFLIFILNAIPAMKLRFERQPEGLTSVITFKPVPLHWIFVGLSILMVGILLTYSLFENRIPILPGT